MSEMIQQISSWDIWEVEMGGNSLARYGHAVLIFLALFVLFMSLRYVLVRRLHPIAEKSSNKLDDTLVFALKKFRTLFFLVVSAYAALQYLTLDPWVDHAAHIVFVFWLIFRAAQAAQILLNYIVASKTAADEEPSSRAMMGVLSWVISVVIWILGALLLMANLGININSLIAGLGIGGLAIALAAQNILGDLFSSLSIVFDKPFVPGDVILIGEHIGVVERVGIRTTRIRTLQGEELVVPNKELVSVRIQNFKRMQERRILFRFGVEYQTPTDLLEQIPGMVKEIVEKQENVRFDRAHFLRFDDSALTFEVVYFVLTADYLTYMNANQAILLQIRRSFEERKIAMAYPTRTLYLHNS